MGLNSKACGPRSILRAHLPSSTWTASGDVCDGLAHFDSMTRLSPARYRWPTRGAGMRPSYHPDRGRRGPHRAGFDRRRPPYLGGAARRRERRFADGIELAASDNVPIGALGAAVNAVIESFANVRGETFAYQRELEGKSRPSNSAPPFASFTPIIEVWPASSAFPCGRARQFTSVGNDERLLHALAEEDEIHDCRHHRIEVINTERPITCPMARATTAGRRCVSPASTPTCAHPSSTGHGTRGHWSDRTLRDALQQYVRRQAKAAATHREEGEHRSRTVSASSAGLDRGFTAAHYDAARARRIRDAFSMSEAAADTPWHAASARDNSTSSYSRPSLRPRDTRSPRTTNLPLSAADLSRLNRRMSISIR